MPKVNYCIGFALGVWDVVGEAYCQRRVTVRDACGCDVKVFVIPAIWRTDVDLRGVPKAKIELVSRPETGDISPMLLSYNIGLQYKQFKWRLVKKASQVLYLHFALKKRAFIEELYEKQEQVKEWLQSMGIVDQTAVVQDDDEPDDGAIPLHHQVSVKNRNVPSIAALPIIRPALGGKQSISDRGKVAMQSSLNHFLGNMDIVNSREACKFLEVSKLSFILQYGSKLKEGYIMVNCRNQSIKLRTTSSAKVGDWVTEINKAGLRPQEGWCQSHCFGSFAPQRGLVEDGNQAQWFIDGQAAFEAIASSIENAKSEIFITGWWICPEMFLKRPFDSRFNIQRSVVSNCKGKFARFYEKIQ